jgi:hypothetical protein
MKTAGQMTVIGIICTPIGGSLGFLARPYIPLIGEKLPFEHVISRGSTLSGLDTVLVPLAKRSFNVMLYGAICGLIAGVLIGFIVGKLSRKKV